MLEVKKLKKIARLFFKLMLIVSLFNIYSFAMPEALPSDLGSNAKLLEIITPEDARLFVCMGALLDKVEKVSYNANEVKELIAKKSAENIETIMENFLK